MKKQMILAAGLVMIALATCATTAQAETIAHYDFEDLIPDTTSLPSSDVAGFASVTTTDVDQFSMASNIGVDTLRDSQNTALPSRGLVIAPSVIAGDNPLTQSPVSTIDYLFFTVTNSSPKHIEFDEFSFDWGLSSDAFGGLMAASQLFVSTDGLTFSAVGSEITESTTGSNTAPDFTGMINRTVSLSSVALLAPSDSIEFRLAFRDNSGAGTGDKGQYLDNLIVTGELVTPEPSTFALVTLGLMPLGMVRRRRRR